MSGAPQDWLPPGAVERPAVRAAVEPVVADWAAHWFARGDLRLSDWGLAGAHRPAPDAAWRPCGPGLGASYSTRATMRLAGLALDMRLDGVDLSERDRLLVSTFARRIVDDLAQRLRRLLGDDPPAGVPEGGRTVIAVIVDGADALLSLSIPLVLLLGLCRRTLTKAVPAAPIAGDRRAALGRSNLRLEATLGAATLSLTEARGLAVGDVLLLDRALTDSADLSIVDAPRVLARGVLSEAEGHLALVLQTAS